MAVDLNTQALTSRLADVSSTTGGLRHILEAAAARGTDPEERPATRERAND